MPLQFTTIEEPSFARGIDARSAENQIQAGFAKDLVNVDIVEGRVSKRKGNISHAGNIPVRIRSIEQVSGVLSFLLDASIDLARIVPGPIAVYGKSNYFGRGTRVGSTNNIDVVGTVSWDNLDTVKVISSTITNVIPGKTYLVDGVSSVNSNTRIFLRDPEAGNATVILSNSGQVVFDLGPIVADNVRSRYYPTWVSNLRKVFTKNLSSTVVIPATEHNILDSRMFVGVAEATEAGGTKLSGSTIFTDAVVISDTSYAITVGYNNNTNEDVSAFIYYADQSPVLGKSYTHSFTKSPSTSEQFSIISAATHDLDNFNIQYQLYQKGTGLWTQVVPESFTINSVTGQVTVGVINNTAASVEYRLILVSTPNNQTRQSVAASIGELTIPDIDSPYLFYNIYSRTGNTLTEIKIDSSIYNDDTNEWTISWTEAPTDIQTLEIYYSYGSIRTNKITVTETNPDYTKLIGTDSSPEVCIYGLSHAELYGNDKEVNRRGWVNHIDSYRSPTTSHMVAGLGGNLFSAIAPAGSLLLPTWHCNLNGRVATNTKVGPAFADLSDVPPPASTNGRTRGGYYFSGGTFGWAVVTSVTYDANSKFTSYVLSMPNGQKTVGSTPIAAGDLLTVENMSHSRHSGVFEIIDVEEVIDENDNKTIVSGQITVVVNNPKLTSTDYNDVDTGGRAGVFSDHVTLQDTSPFIEDDILLSSAWGDATLLKARQITTTVVQNSNTTKVFVSNVLAFPASGTVTVAGQSYNYTATTPAENSITLTVAANVSAGQEVVLISSKLYLKNCYNFVTLNAGLVITGKRTSDTIPLRKLDLTIPEDTELYIVPGDVLIFSELNREVVVTSVDTDKITITLDEEIEWYDDLSLPPSFTVARRWYPIEAPARTSTDVLVPATTVQHFSANSYDNQPFLRSAMVSNNLYLTNGQDEVYKYDGTHLYRAGLIPWQPGLFATVENVINGGIALAPREVAVASASFKGGSIEVNSDEGRKLEKGDYVEIRFDNGVVQYMTVAGIVDITGTNKVSITFNETFVGVALGTPILSIRIVYYASYFFRLNLKDPNGVTVASAVTGDESFKVQVIPTAQYTSQRVLLRLVGLPPWDQYDYRQGNIELEIYRTPWTTKSVGEVIVPYRLKTIPLTYEAASGYIDFTDSYSNLSLSGEDTDRVFRILSPTQVPVDWDEPARAKYLTTTGNRLVLANITDWPSLTVNYLTNKDTNDASFVGQKFLFRRDALDTGTTTDMVNRVTYELKAASSALTIYPVIEPSLTNTFRFAATTALPTLAPGDWVYLYHNALSSGNNATVTVSTSTEKFSIAATNIPDNTLVHFSCTGTYPVYSSGTITPGRGYFVVQSGSNEFKISLTPGGTPLDITVANTGTLTVLWDGSELEYSGWWQVGSVSGGIVTISKSGSNFNVLPTQFPDRALFATSTKDVPVLVGVDGNLVMTDGNSIVPYLNVIRRLGLAINATMRLVNTGLSAYSKFVPWLTARSEAATNGQLIVKRPRADAETPSLTMTAAGADSVPTYINSELATVNETVIAAIAHYPSRVLISYDNYPEIFSNPFTPNLDESDSAVDINASDGQEITGIVPFFGSSAFDAAQQSGVLIVFKQNSIYVLKVATREVQKLETQGLGCNAPYSIAPTKDGIAFANETGVYVLRPSLRIEYLGRYMERNWQQRVDLSSLDIAQGHHYGTGRQYKLSIPLAEESTVDYSQNAEVYVYSYTREADGELGGWTRYTNHAATGWANLFENAFFATVNGTVQKVRNLNEASDYRDGNLPITSTIETRPTAFENTAIRKAVSNVVVHYRSRKDSDSTTLGMAIDMANQYQLSSNYRVVTSGVNDGLSTKVDQSIVSIMHSFPKRKCTYASVRIVNSGIDENVEVAGMSYVVAGLSSAGIKQAAETEG